MRLESGSKKFEDDDGRKVVFEWDELISCACKIWEGSRNELLEEQSDSVESDN